MPKCVSNVYKTTYSASNIGVTVKCVLWFKVIENGAI